MSRRGAKSPAEKPVLLLALIPMKRLGQDSTHPQTKGRGAVVVGARPSASHREPARRDQATLEIGADALSDEAVRGLLEDWLIPAIVEDIVQAQTKETPCDPIRPR